MTLAALVLIRWFALFAQLAVFLLTLGVVEHEVALWPFVACFVAGCATNLTLWSVRSREERKRDIRLMGFIVAFDVIVLGILLFFYGGYANPFSMMLLVYVILAACFLGTAWTWVTFGLSLLCYFTVFFWYTPFPSLMTHAHHHHEGFDLHLHGMIIAFTIMGTLVSYFVTKLTKEIEVLRRERFAQDTIAALTTVVAGATHELATPLGTSLLIAEELEKQPTHDGMVTVPREDIEELARQLKRTRETLAQMRGRSPELQGEVRRRVRGEELITRILARMSERERGRIKIVHPVDAPPFETLSFSLEESLVVLLRNALESDSNEGRIDLTVEQGDSEIAYTVRDYGRGVPVEDLDRLGQPFFTTKVEQHGMGLGLFLVRSFVGQVHGSLTFRNMSPGFEVTVRVPI